MGEIHTKKQQQKNHKQTGKKQVGMDPRPQADRAGEDCEVRKGSPPLPPENGIVNKDSRFTDSPGN